MTSVRTDIHRPSAIQPQDYDFVGVWYDPQESEVVGGSLLLREEQERIEEHMDRMGGSWATHQHGGSCFCCGASALYLAVFYHPATNEYIRVGETCTEKLALGVDDAFRKTRAAVKNSREKLQRKGIIEAFIQREGLSDALEIYKARGEQEGREERTIVDIIANLMRWGSLSEKQLNYLKHLTFTVRNRAAIEAQRAAEKAAAKDCPKGRHTVTGTILSLREVEGRWGFATKMFVKADEGYTLWGTVPSSIKPEKGMRVTFTATIEPAGDDPKHGFFSRPSAQRA